MKSTNRHVLASSKMSRFIEFSVDNAINSLYWMTEDARFFYVNKHSCRDLGYSREELLKMSVFDISPNFPRDKWPRHWADLKKKGMLKQEAIHQRKDGTLFPVEVVAQYIEFEGREYNCASVRDITERVNRNEDLSKARDDVKYANRIKTQFLASMSHDLRTPLNSIIGFADMMKNETFGPLGHDKYVEYATDISSAGGYLLGRITDILDISKIESETLDFNEKKINLNRTVIPCMRLTQKKADLAEVTLAMDIPYDLPLLLADPMRIKQIVLNLLSNSVKFTPPGGQITVEGILESDGSITLKVRDTGSGISKESITRILEPLDQNGGSLAINNSGAGLGLLLVGKFAEMHGGTMAIDSEVGEGTTVSVYFPKERSITY